MTARARSYAVAANRVLARSEHAGQETGRRAPRGCTRGARAAHELGSHNLTSDTSEILSGYIIVFSSLLYSLPTLVWRAAGAERAVPGRPPSLQL